MSGLQVVGIDRAQALAEGGLDGAAVYQGAQLVEDVALALHGGGEHGAGEHELPAEAGAFWFQGVQVQGGTGIDDGADATERGHRLAGAVPVFVQTLGDQDAVHLGGAEQLQLRQQFLAVVHHLMGAHGLAPVGGGVAPGGGNHGQSEMVGG